LEVNSALIQNQDNGRGGLDPNYFGYQMGTGAFLSVLFFYYFDEIKNELRFKISRNIGKALLILLAFFQFFLSLKGLSRGVFLSVLFTYGVLVFTVGKIKANVFRAILLLLGISFILIQSGIFDAIIGRFMDDSSADRGVLVGIVITAMFNYGGILALLFGGGSDFPWQNYSLVNSYNYYSYYSTHNSWLDFMVSYGIIGLVLLLICIFSQVRYHYNKKSNPLSVIKVVMFSFVFTIGLSLEPLRSQLGWLIIALCFV
jgi:O-antigen ligase